MNVSLSIPDPLLAKIKQAAAANAVSIAAYLRLAAIEKLKKEVFNEDKIQ